MNSLANFTIDRVNQQTGRAAPLVKRIATQQAQQIGPLVTEPVEVWGQKNFFIPELGGPIQLEPYQIAALREASRIDSAGRFIYSLVVWSDIKKSAKSCIAAMVALYRAHTVKWGGVRIVANDLKQADSRVAFFLRRAITLNPAMANIRQVMYKTTLPNQTTIEAVPIDPGGEAGGNDDLIIFSELWAAKNKAAMSMWVEMTLSPLKFGYSQRWVETYAGHEGDSPLLEPLYERIERGRQLDLSYTDEGGKFHDLSDLEIYKEGQALILWNTRPRCPWQTEAYYQSEAETLPPSEFDRIHANKWASGLEQFVNAASWRACEGELSKFGRRAPMVIAVDAAVSGDCFGIVGTTRRGGLAQIRYTKAWTPPKGGKIDYSGPENELVRLMRAYRVVEVRYDEYQLHDMMTRLARRFRRVTFSPFPQAGKRLVADKQLRDNIEAAQVRYQGEPELAQHINNANAKIEGERLRLVKRASGKPIDLAVALSMAQYVEPPAKSKRRAPGIVAQGSAKGWLA